MDELDRPAEAPAAESTDAIAESTGTGNTPAGDPNGDAGKPARAARKPRSTTRRKRKTAEEPAPEPEAVAGAPAAEIAPEPAAPEPVEDEEAEQPVATLDATLEEAIGTDGPLDAAEMEVIEAGEPIPLLQRETLAGIEIGTTALASDILVPDAVVESPPGDFLEIPPASSREPSLLAITPEILAEVRGVTPEEVQQEQATLAQRRALESPVEVRPAARTDGGRRDRQERPPAPRPAPDGAAQWVLVPEALLETVPEDWAEEEAEDTGVLAPSFAPGGRRRGRRRGRDRDRRGGPEEQARETPAPAARPAAPSLPSPTPVAGITVLGAPDDETTVSRERDRREREPKADREHKEILVNVADRETRIAVLENGRLVELHVEREERVVGNIYKGRVSNVLQGMDAAFVDLGLERNAFLYVGDILFEDTSKSRDGEAPARRTSRDVRITDLAKPGQEIFVQVVKGPRGTKGARVSTKVSIPGRYLVLMPDADHLGVSRKIEDVRERERLRRLAEQIQPKGFGVIIRTEAEGRSDTEIRQDLEYLVRSWQAIMEKNKRAHAPALLHKDVGIILKTIRDLFGSDTDRLVIDSREEFEKIVDTLEQLAPELVDRVALYDEPEPLFSRFNLEEEIEKLLRRKVWLRNGAYLLLDTTEALTTIDVNTGKFVGTSSLAETILKTNLDAVDEIARQLRLRDIGGMIVLDFIDMSSSQDRHKVMRALEHAFRKDRTRIKIAHISPLGLVEMTRKRTSEAVTDVMSHTCPYCQGRGRVWSPETMAIQIERAVMQMCAKSEVDAVMINANPEVAAHLIGPEGESVEQLERMLRRPVYIRARHDYHVEKYDVLAADMMELERQMMPFHGGQVVDCQVTKIELITPPRSAAWVDGYFVDLANGARYQGQHARVRLTDVRRSFALGEPVAPSTAVDRSEPI